MATEPRLSVIIPAYNHATYLVRAMDSVVAQLHATDELHVVDDGSTDTTADVVVAYARGAAGQVFYTPQAHAGPGAARNHGVQQAHGDAVIFLDADDALLPDALRRFRRELMRRPGVNAVIGGYISVDKSGRQKIRHMPSLRASARRNLRALVDGRLKIAHGSTCIRRQVFDHLRYPETIWNNEDLVFNGHLLALYDCRSFAAPTVQVFAHMNRLRDNIETIDAAGDRVVELLFDADRLPPDMMRLRDRFRAQHLLSRMRANYRAGRWREARALYRAALALRPASILQGTYLRKYLRCVLAGVRAAMRNSAPVEGGPR